MNIHIRSRGRLPHWEVDNGTYFITFRTADAVTPRMIAALHMSKHTPDQVRKEIEKSLDLGSTGDILRGPVAEIVAKSILFGHGRDYSLDAWCVMPNHVHLLINVPRHNRLAHVIQASPVPHIASTSFCEERAQSGNESTSTDWYDLVNSRRFEGTF